MKTNKQIMRDHFNNRINSFNNITMTPPLPENLNIEINNTCNHRCVFCPYHGKYSNGGISPAVLDVPFVKELMNQAKTLGIGRKELGFYIAGEPFMHNGLIEVTSYAKELGFPYVFMTSNGALATPEKMKLLLDAGLDSIRFSVNASDRNSYKEIHGRDDFDAVVDTLKFTHQYITDNKLKVATSISCVLTKETVNIKKEMLRLFEEYVDDIVFIPVLLGRLYNNAEAKAKYKLINEDDMSILPDYICPLLFNTMYIDANAHVVPCCDAYFDNSFFADLKENPDLQVAWNSEGYRKFRGIFLEGLSDKGTICEDCILRKKAPSGLFMDE